MTIHYHGLPITPNSVFATLAGRCFCVRYGEHAQAGRAHDIGQSVMLDNGAFSFWRQEVGTDWPGYYEWAERWLDYRTTWAVIPDVIDGDEDANDALIDEWPFGEKGSPVWHMHEPIDRFLRLADRWPRVCVGSSGQFSAVGDSAWRRRMDDAMNQLCSNGPPPAWLHMLRGMALSGSEYPFASVDSTDVARNHNREGNTALQMAARWDARQCPPRWSVREQIAFEEAA